MSEKNDAKLRKEKKKEFEKKLHQFLEKSRAIQYDIRKNIESKIGGNPKRR